MVAMTNNVDGAVGRLVNVLRRMGYPWDGRKRTDNDFRIQRLREGTCDALMDIVRSVLVHCDYVYNALLESSTDMGTRKNMSWFALAREWNTSHDGGSLKYKEKDVRMFLNFCRTELHVKTVLSSKQFMAKVRVYCFCIRRGNTVFKNGLGEGKYIFYRYMVSAFTGLCSKEDGIHG